MKSAIQTTILFTLFTGISAGKNTTLVPTADVMRPTPFPTDLTDAPVIDSGTNKTLAPTPGVLRPTPFPTDIETPAPTFILSTPEPTMLSMEYILESFGSSGKSGKGSSHGSGKSGKGHHGFHGKSGKGHHGKSGKGHHGKSGKGHKSGKGFRHYDGRDHGKYGYYHALRKREKVEPPAPILIEEPATTPRSNRIQVLTDRPRTTFPRRQETTFSVTNRPFTAVFSSENTPAPTTTTAPPPPAATVLNSIPARDAPGLPEAVPASPGPNGEDYYYYYYYYDEEAEQEEE